MVLIGQGCGPRIVASGWAVLVCGVGVHGIVRLCALRSGIGPLWLQLGLGFELLDLIL